MIRIFQKSTPFFWNLSSPPVILDDIIIPIFVDYAFIIPEPRVRTRRRYILTQCARKYVSFTGTRIFVFTGRPDLTSANLNVFSTRFSVRTRVITFSYETTVSLLHLSSFGSARKKRLFVVDLLNRLGRVGRAAYKNNNAVVGNAFSGRLPLGAAPIASRRCVFIIILLRDILRTTGRLLYCYSTRHAYRARTYCFTTRVPFARVYMYVF